MVYVLRKRDRIEETALQVDLPLEEPEDWFKKRRKRAPASGTGEVGLRGMRCSKRPAINSPRLGILEVEFGAIFFVSSIPN